jgi:hypothetical protein
MKLAGSVTNGRRDVYGTAQSTEQHIEIGIVAQTWSRAKTVLNDGRL